MNTEEIKIIKYKAIYIFAVCSIIFIIGFLLGCLTNKVYNRDNYTLPVEEIVKVDSLIKVNDSLKIKVNNLDSIKNAKIIEVQSIDNDSTIKLFYKLIRKK